MSRSQKVDLLLYIPLCLLSVQVQSLNYGYSVPNSQAYPTFIAPASILNTNGSLEKELLQNTKKTESSYTIYYPRFAFPQRRGGKNLNFTLITEPPSKETHQPRILNQPGWYSPFAVSDLPPKKVSPISRPSSLQQINTGKRTAVIRQDTIYLPETNRVTELPYKILKHSKTPGYFLPPQFRIPSDEPPSFDLQTHHKNTNFRYKFPPHLYEVTSSGYSFPPPRQETNQNLPCFCVPYYLCKNGVINSGGRSLAAVRRISRTPKQDITNTTQSPTSVQPKAYVIEQESDDPIQCESQKICCRLSFADDIPSHNDGKYYPNARPRPELYYPIPTPRPEPYYPVVTPRPELYYPSPARIPNNELETCGIQRAYGIHARLQQLLYSADVSEFGEYPWQAAILRRVEGQKSLYLCGGALIASQWVVTAAHCLKKQEYYPLLIRLGEWDVNRMDEVYPYVEKNVDSVILHPEFNPDSLYNDIALIHMSSPVDARLPHISPVCLPKRDTVYQDQRCWVSGWGKDFFGTQGEYQNVLKEVDVPVIMREICAAELKHTNLGPDFVLHPGFLCAGGEAGKDACTGDGGSPLVCMSGRTWYVVGLVSWGIGCGQPGVPGVYVNMLYYIDWINAIVWR